MIHDHTKALMHLTFLAKLVVDFCKLNNLNLEHDTWKLPLKRLNMNLSSWISTLLETI